MKELLKVCHIQRWMCLQKMEHRWNVLLWKKLWISEHLVPGKAQVRGKRVFLYACFQFYDFFNSFSNGAVHELRNRRGGSLRIFKSGYVICARPLTGGWQDWGYWSQCSKSWDPVSKIRARLCVAAVCKGQPFCEQDSTHPEECKTKDDCPGSPGENPKTALFVTFLLHWFDLLFGLMTKSSASFDTLS